MPFLGFGKKETDEDRKAKLLKAERAYDQKKREDFVKSQDDAKKAAEDTEPSTDPHDTTPKPKKRLKDRISGIGHNIKVKAAASKLKRYRKHKEKEEAKANEKAKVKSDSEKEAFGRELTDDEREDYDEYREERKAVKAERRRKLKEGISKLTNGSDGEGGGGLSDIAGIFSLGGGSPSEGKGKKKNDSGDSLTAMFAIKSAPLDANVVDDDKQYGKKSGIADDGNVFGLGNLGKENPFGMGGGNPFDFNVTDDKKQYGKKAGAIQNDNPFSMGDFGKGAEDLFTPTFLKDGGKKGKSAKQANPLDIFGTSELRQKKNEFERIFSLTWGEKPKRKRKVKPLKDPLGLL